MIGQYKMRLSKKTIGTLVITSMIVVFVLLTCFYILPIAKMVSRDMKQYETRIAYREDYKLHTTPLPKTVVEDVCLKLSIKNSSENCRSDAVIYAPEFFDEIKSHFNDLPDQSKTYGAVQDKLGVYLIRCEKPALDGNYRCTYDLRGDEIYPFFFYYDKEGFYYQIMANIGGS